MFHVKIAKLNRKERKVYGSKNTSLRPLRVFLILLCVKPFKFTSNVYN